MSCVMFLVPPPETSYLLFGQEGRSQDSCHLFVGPNVQWGSNIVRNAGEQMNVSVAELPTGLQQFKYSVEGDTMDIL